MIAVILAMILRTNFIPSIQNGINIILSRFKIKFSPFIYYLIILDVMIQN